MRAPAVDLMAESWLPGLRTVAIFGPVSVEVIAPTESRRWLRALVRLRRLLDEEAQQLGAGRATHIMGLEQTFDPFREDGVLFTAKGMVTRMEPVMIRREVQSDF